MSPEQATGSLDELGPVSDVYSLGATLYHLLCGKPPFEKEDLAEILSKVKRGDFPKPRSVSPEVAAVLESICLKAMAVKTPSPGLFLPVLLQTTSSTGWRTNR